MILDALGTRLLSIVLCIAQRRFSFLIFDLHEPLMLLYQIFANFGLAISSSKMKGRISKFVLVVNFIIFFLAYAIYDIQVSGLSSRKQGRFIEFIFDRRSQTPQEQIMDGFCLLSLSREMKQTVAKGILKAYRKLATFQKHDDVDESVGCGHQHYFTRIFAYDMNSYFSQIRLSFKSTFNLGLFAFNLLNCHIEFLKLLFDS